jgi:hypothetical protein
MAAAFYLQTEDEPITPEPASPEPEESTDLNKEDEEV